MVLWICSKSPKCMLFLKSKTVMSLGGEHAPSLYQEAGSSQCSLVHWHSEDMSPQGPPHRLPLSQSAHIWHCWALSGWPNVAACWMLPLCVGRAVGSGWGGHWANLTVVLQCLTRVIRCSHHMAAFGDSCSSRSQARVAQLRSVSLTAVKPGLVFFLGKDRSCGKVFFLEVRQPLLSVCSHSHVRKADTHGSKRKKVLSV